MGTLLGLGAVLAYHEHRCRVSRKRELPRRNKGILYALAYDGSVFMYCRNTTHSLLIPQADCGWGQNDLK